MQVRCIGIFFRCTVICFDFLVYFPGYVLLLDLLSEIRRLLISMFVILEYSINQNDHTISIRFNI